MLTPEIYVATGVLLVIVSLLLIVVARSVRSWFFFGDLKSELQPALAQNTNQQ